MQVPDSNRSTLALEIELSLLRVILTVKKVNQGLTVVDDDRPWPNRPTGVTGFLAAVLSPARLVKRNFFLGEWNELDRCANTINIFIKAE